MKQGSSLIQQLVATAQAVINIHTYVLVFGLSLEIRSLSRSCIVLKLPKISTRFLLRMTVPCLSQIWDREKIWPTPSSQNFAPKWPARCWFERQRHSIANCGGQMVRDSAMITTESLYEITISLLNVAILSQGNFGHWQH